ncbi:uncharacterized protein LOC109863128 isoform X2 [Pseudomyrmex gracilis]|uniref:uncharacterized protein LOC109863128 isoform X2 n=1 Tax=Pseudomyrmex gracilis TaxID=219809 RepID=UPI0009953BE4|nr:uncharacterized protein LOC109863128 isoform X2 [Pseudomyrmex gracilis]
MSENTTAENISFQENENIDDSELQSKLYANIYYESHNAEATTATTKILKAIHFDNMTNKLSSEQENTQANTDTNQLLESASTIRLTDQETSSVIQDHVNTDNDRYSGKFSTTERKENNKNFSQKHKSSNNITDKDSDILEIYSKYNVLQKQEKKKLVKKADKETSDGSESDNSIFEVPIPPKPKPPLINLQDSDEEDNVNARMSENDTTKSNKTAKITCIPEDIALNCSLVHSPTQRGASSLNEIRQLSRSAEQNQEELSKTKNQSTNKNLSHNKTTKNNINRRLTLEGNSPITKQPNTDKNISECNVNNFKPLDQDQLHNISIEVSCTNSNPNRKRQFTNKLDESSKEKRQCSSQHTSQDNGSKVRRKESWNDYIFKPMTDEMKAYYNSTQIHEDFDVVQLQHNMSNDPRKWGILDEDLMPRPSSNKQHVRFWNVKCGNCRQNGHQRYDCSAPRKAINCYICGEKGHNESRCPKKSCLTCGHQRKYCPDLWRRYHQITTMDSLPQNPGNVMKPRSQLHCCNCAKYGHESSTCKEYRWSQHFPTPAAVTSYTCGPRYRPDDMSVSSLGQFTQEANVFLSTEMRNGLIPHSSLNVQETTQYSEFSANACLLPVSESKVTLHRREAMSLPEGERTIATSSTICNKNKTKEIDFYHVMYHYSKLRNKNNEKMQIMLKNLSDLIRTAEASIYVKETISSLAKGEVTPDFFKALTDKEIELEVTIGFKTPENNNLTLQIIALQKNLKEIYKLFLYWIELPNDEKDYGIDVSLPTNLTKMYNLLDGRRQQLEKQKFKSYKEFVETRSQNLLHLIKYEKKQLTQHNRTKKEYRRLRTKLWRLQIKLLMIVNTEPKANNYVHQYYVTLHKLKKSKKVFDVLDNVAFLRIILLYNNLFVPHTPINAEQTINCIMKKAQQINKMNEQVAMNTLQAQQEICNHTIQPFYTDVNLPSEPSTFHMPQDNFIESSSMINIQQTAPTDVSFRDDVNILPNTNDSTNHTCDDEVIITYVSDQIENIQPTAPTNIEKKQKKKQKIELKISDSVKILNLINQARAFNLPYMLQAADKLEKSKNNGMLRKKHVNTLTKLIELEKKHRKNVNSYCKSLGK